MALKLLDEMFGSLILEKRFDLQQALAVIVSTTRNLPPCQYGSAVKFRINFNIRVDNIVEI